MSTDIQKPSLSRETLRRVKLETDEVVLWSGKPLIKTSTKKFDPKYLVLLSLVLCVVLLLFTNKNLMQAINDPEPWMAPIFGFACVVGLFLFMGLVIPLWINFEDQETVYLITDKRALILKPNQLYQFKAGLFLDRVDRQSSGKSDIILDRITNSDSPGMRRTVVGFLGLSKSEADVAEPLLMQVLNPPLIRQLTEKENNEIL